MSERKNEVFGRGPSDPAVPRRDVMQEDFGLDIPAVTVPLPSQGKVYPTTHPLYGSDTVDIKAMTAREEDILTSRALLKKGTVINELLRSCITTPGVDTSTMLSGDRNAVMISIRITGYGQSYDAEIVCAECGEKVEARFDLADLPIKRLVLEPCQPGQNLFEFTLPVTKKKVTFRFLTGADEQDLAQEAERRKKILGAGGPDSLVTSKLHRLLVSVGEITDRSKIGMFVKSMPAGDSRALRKFIEENEPGIEMKSTTTCPMCGESQEVEMPMGVKFFWPDQ